MSGKIATSEKHKGPENIIILTSGPIYRRAPAASYFVIDTLLLWHSVDGCSFSNKYNK